MVLNCKINSIQGRSHSWCIVGFILVLPQCKSGEGRFE